MIRIPFAGLSAACMVMIGLGGCTSARIGSELSVDDPDYPVRNDAPRQVVQVSGQLSASLNLQLHAHYGATVTEGCTWTPSLITGAFEGVAFRLQHSLVLPVHRDDQRIISEFTVDRYLPGRCGWQFAGVSAAVSKGQTVSIARTVIRAVEGRSTPVPQDWQANMQPSPVIWRCRFDSADSPDDGIEVFYCGEDIREQRLKGEHLLDSTTTRVELRFIDLDSP
ncbi:MAG: hypothetical protein R3E83_06725 [Burkholderiaceae bacterium]